MSTCRGSNGLVYRTHLTHTTYGKNRVDLNLPSPALADPNPPSNGRFDLIDSSYLSDTLGVLNVVMAASPLLKPSPHAVVRTDLRRSGPARKRLTRREDVENAYTALSEAERCGIEL